MERDLDLLRIEEEDVRFDIFNQIYEMIYDNINLRKKIN
jgi:hypothetical protein